MHLSALHLVCKIYKIQELFPTACINSRPYPWKIFCTKTIFLECLTVILCSVIAIKVHFQNFGLFLVWSCNFEQLVRSVWTVSHTLGSLDILFKGIHRLIHIYKLKVQVFHKRPFSL